MIKILSFLEWSATQMDRIEFTILRISLHNHRRYFACTSMAPNRRSHRTNVTKSQSTELFACFPGANQKKGWGLTASVPAILYRLPGLMSKRGICETLKILVKGVVGCACMRRASIGICRVLVQDIVDLIVNVIFVCQIISCPITPTKVL